MDRSSFTAASALPLPRQSSPSPFPSPARALTCPFVRLAPWSQPSATGPFVSPPTFRSGSVLTALSPFRRTRAQRTRPGSLERSGVRAAGADDKRTRGKGERPVGVTLARACRWVRMLAHGLTDHKHSARLRVSYTAANAPLPSRVNGRPDGGGTTIDGRVSVRANTLANIYGCSDMRATGTDEEWMVW